jgi:hypothetical protein
MLGLRRPLVAVTLHCSNEKPLAIARLMSSDNESMIVHTGGNATLFPTSKRAREGENEDADKRSAKRPRKGTR